MAKQSYKVKGTTTEVTTCECCGRNNLRRTVALIPLDLDGNEDGPAAYFGTSCAAALLRWTSNQVNTSARYADMQAEIDRHYARERAHRILNTFEPIEFAPLRTRADAYRESGLHLEGVPFTTVTNEIKQMLREARELLAA